MAELTMGQRISEERKKLGLSQEALGEKMSVSRQSISKWEADGAVPEIDKLIALSKLFGVSVGWLLGVEEASPHAPQQEVLSEQQLYMIEEIVKKYQPKPGPTKFRLLLNFGIAVLGLVSILIMTLAGMGIFDRKSESPAVLDALRFEMNSQLAELHSRIDSLNTSQVQPSVEVLLADYSLEISGMVTGTQPRAEITFSAVPVAWKDGDSATLSIRRAGMDTILEPCQWDGAFLTATVFLEPANGYELCLAVNHADGTQEQQVLQDPIIRDLEKSLNITLEATSGKWSYENNTLTLRNYAFKITTPMNGKFYGTISWEQVELILVTGKGEELGRFSLLSAAMEEDADVLASPEVWMEHAEIKFVGLELPKEEGILLYLSAETSNGLKAMEPITAWATDSAGKLRTQ